ncbi:MAG: class I SAM-dependent methyltransferase [Anaerolineae bacterium]
MTIDFIRYLDAKRFIDDRSLNRHVWQTLVSLLDERHTGPLRILELGAGIGTMLDRFKEWRLYDGQILYHGVDQQNTEVARQRFSDGTRTGDRVTARFTEADVFAFAAETQDQWDLLVAHAFLDLVHIPEVLPDLFTLLRPGGLFYFTLTFDGVTALEPPVDPELDKRIVDLYHRSMDTRIINGKPSGDSRAGRHLLHHLREADAVIEAAGGSDWVVMAGPNGVYQGDEAYFLQHILHFFDEALRGQIDAGTLDGWLTARQRQINEGTLIYIAHQIDVVGTRG